MRNTERQIKKNRVKVASLFYDDKTLGGGDDALTIGMEQKGLYLSLFKDSNRVNSESPNLIRIFLPPD